MTLRKILSKLYPLLKNNEPCSFLFFIGSFPQRVESNHELPEILKNLGVNTQRIYIDPGYIDEPLGNTLNRIGNNCYIHPYNITDEEYNMIIEFCHIAGILNDSLSIIFEFTGIMRLAYEKNSNRKPYLYISPSDCLADTNDILYNPVIINNNNKLEFYRPNLDEIGNEIEILFQGEMDFIKQKKLQFIGETINIFKTEIKDVYRLLLNYMERKDCFSVDHNVVFIKEVQFFYASMELLKKRMAGYNQYKAENVIEEFMNSESADFEIFIKEKIQNLLGIILLFHSQGDRYNVNTNFESIMFDNSRQVYEIVKRMEQINI
tara:strand:+ start:708 stop:1667 length:960 start_codon:yes stop_codon:yes gene_type:complete